MGIEIEECGPNLCLRVGPFQPGGAKRMLDQMELPGMDVSIAKLADRVEVVDERQGRVHLDRDLTRRGRVRPGA